MLTSGLSQPSDYEIVCSEAVPVAPTSAHSSGCIGPRPAGQISRPDD